MFIVHIMQEDYCVSKWSGGTTTQIAIFPTDAAYADRDFLWRISSASVDLDESDFTSLPDYDRVISTLRGDMTLTHNSGEQITLKPYQVHAFDGGAKTHSIGKCTDFNLMLRKGKCTGELEAIHITGDSKTIKVSLCLKDIKEHSSSAFLLYCAKGMGRVSCGEHEAELFAGETLYITEPDFNETEVYSEEASDFMAARIAF